jgi:succinate dehydrogenase / fumarate reductase iron-sulfur subunit
MDSDNFFQLHLGKASMDGRQIVREQRVLSMVKTMDEAGFGNCTVTCSCEAVCPKEISLDFIAKMNREYGKAILKNSTRSPGKGGD